MTNNVQLIPYAPERVDEVAELLNLALGPKTVGVRDADYWCWKHHDNPFGPSFMLLAEAGGKLVGVRAFMRWEFVLDGETISVAKPVDSVTHPDYQRQGVFSQLTEAACEMAAQQGAQFLFNTPNEKSKPGYLKLGWREVGDLSMRGKVVRPFAGLRHAIGWKLGLRRIEDSVFFKFPPKTAVQVLDDPRLVDLIADRERSPGILETRRSPEFYRWRYAGHPHIEYHAARLESQDLLQGVIFYRTNIRHGIREIMIDEILVRTGATRETVMTLLAEMGTATRGDYWVALIHPATRLAETSGLSLIPGKQILLAARPLQSDEVPPLTKWGLCLGDIEGL